MNIGYIYGFNSYPPRNGGGVHVFNLTENLISLGCTIHVFEPEENPQCVSYPKNNEGIKEFVRNIDILYMRIDGWYLTSENWKLKCMDEAVSVPKVWEINAGIEERLMLQKSANSKTSGSRAMNWFKSRIDDTRLHSKIKQENDCRRRYAANVDAAICVSSENARYAMEELGIDTCRVIPNGSNPAVFSPEHKNDNKFDNYRGYFKVIYSGDSRYPWQGFHYIKELASLSAQRGDKFLYIVLDNAASGTIVEAENLLRCKVEYAEVPEYLASADVCLCLYDDREFSSLPFGFNLSPLKLFDYLASGKPVIGSNLGQIQSVIEDGEEGFLTSNNIDDIYEKLLFCDRNSDKIKDMGTKAREKVLSCYNWNRVARNTHELFRSLI